MPTIASTGGPDGKAPVPSIKMFLSEARGLTPTNFWAHHYAGHTDEGTRDLESIIPGKVFNNPKPVQLVRRMLEHACNGPGDIVLDFFAGSCVTAQAAIELNLEDGGSRKIPSRPTAGTGRRGFQCLQVRVFDRLPKSAGNVFAASSTRRENPPRDNSISTKGPPPTSGSSRSVLTGPISGFGMALTIRRDADELVRQLETSCRSS